MATVAELRLLITGKSELGTMLSGVKKDLNSLGSQATKAGTALSAGLTLPIIGLGTVAVKAAVDFESAFAGVRKTVNGTEQDMAILKQGIRDMAKEVPASAVAISSVAEAAGQLGIAKNNILSFTKVMIDLGETTNLTADEAATSLAQLANIMQMPQKEFDRLGATLVALGNSGASTERDIVAMAVRIAAAGKVVGLTVGEVLGFSNALASVGVEAEAGGSSISKVIVDIASSVKSGSKDLALFAKVAGVSVADFKHMFETDAAGAIVTFVEGLRTITDAGGNVFAVLDALGLSEVRTRNALLSLAGGGDILRQSLDLQGKAWSENTALTKEAAERYKTVAAQWQVFKNKLNDVAITLGEALLPLLIRLIERANPLIEWISAAAQAFSQLDADTKKWVVVGLAAAAAIGPLLLLFGGMASGIAALIPLVGFLASSFVPLAVAGLIIYGLIRNWDDLSRTVIGAVSGITRAVNGLVGVFNAALNAVLRVVTAVAHGIYLALQWLNPFATHSPALVDQVRDGIAEIAANFKRLEEVERQLEGAESSVRAFEDSMASLSASMRADALAGTLSDINKAAGSQAANAYRTASSALDDLTKSYSEMGAAILASAQKFDPAIESVDDLRAKISGLKNAISDLTNTPLLEEKGFDQRSKAVQKQMDELQLRIVKLKQQGPLTQDFIVRETSAKGKVSEHKETRDTALGTQVKGLEAELERIGLKASQIDLEKKLAIDPLKDKIASLTETAPLPFATIVKGIQDANAELKNLTPISDQADAYDKLGDRIRVQTAIMSDFAAQASEVVRAQEAAASAAAAAAEKSAGGIADVMAQLDELGAAANPMKDLSADARDLQSSVAGIAAKAEEFKVKIQEMKQEVQKFRDAVMPIVGPFWKDFSAGIQFIIDNQALLIAAVIGIGVAIAFALGPGTLAVLAVIGIIALIGHFRDESQAVLDFMTKHWPAIGAIISGPFPPLVELGKGLFGLGEAMVGGLTDAWNKFAVWGDSVYNFFATLPARFRAAFGTDGGFDFIWQSFKSAINKMISAWNNLSFSLPAVDTKIPGVGKVGGMSLNTPNIPLLKSGLAYVPRDNFPAILHKGEAVIPASQNRPGMGGGINFYGPINITEARDARRAMKDFAFVAAAELRSRGMWVPA